ncbi:MAG TPA: sirohydrochlorin chelatase [Pseudonocardiaceae bacterium]|jgi:sirohydrochlorin ferrochelatase|nr:sirohydrochlorin chelatase [Pseudonocardiaceae bacterium]
MTLPLVAVAHGSRDPRSAATVMELLDVVRVLRPGLDVRVAFLDLSAPRLGDVLRAVHGDGHREVVVVPLLLGRAYHARVDVPGAVADVQRWSPQLDVRIADVLGPDPWLESAALRRLAEVGVRSGDPELGIVLAGAGSSDAAANAAVASVARRWAAGAGWAGVEPAFAAAASPDVPTAVNRLRARGARRIAVASWFLAPGLLPDRIASLAEEAAPGTVMAAPLGDDPEVAELVLHRYTAASTTGLSVQYA